MIRNCPSMVTPLVTSGWWIEGDRLSTRQNARVCKGPSPVRKPFAHSHPHCSGRSATLCTRLSQRAVESAPRLSLDSHALVPFNSTHNTSPQSVLSLPRSVHSHVSPFSPHYGPQDFTPYRPHKRSSLACRCHRSGLNPCSVWTDCPATDLPFYCLEHAIRSHRPFVSGFDITDTIRYGVTTTQRGCKTKTSTC